MWVQNVGAGRRAALSPFAYAPLFVPFCSRSVCLPTASINSSPAFSETVTQKIRCWILPRYVLVKAGLLALLKNTGSVQAKV